MSSFREKLKDLIEFSNIPIKEHAKLSGISQTSLSQWTRFDIIPETKNIIRIAKYFQCPVDYFLDLTEETKIRFSDNPVPCSERLKALINEKNITQYKASKELHIETAMMTDWIKYGTLPSFDNLILLADYFKCSADYLLGISDSK